MKRLDSFWTVFFCARVPRLVQRLTLGCFHSVYRDKLRAFGHWRSSWGARGQDRGAHRSAALAPALTGTVRELLVGGEMFFPTPGVSARGLGSDVLWHGGIPLSRLVWGSTKWMRIVFLSRTGNTQKHKDLSAGKML